MLHPASSTRPHRRPALVVLGLVLALVAAACGTRVTDGQVAAGGGTGASSSGFAAQDGATGTGDDGGGALGASDGGAGALDGGAGAGGTDAGGGGGGGGDAGAGDATAPASGSGGGGASGPGRSPAVSSRCWPSPGG